MKTVTTLFWKLFSGKVSDNVTEFIDDKTEPKKLKVAEVVVFGTRIQTLFDSEAILDVMNAALCPLIYIVPKRTGRRIKMGNGKERRP